MKFIPLPTVRLERIDDHTFKPVFDPACVHVNPAYIIQLRNLVASMVIQGSDPHTSNLSNYTDVDMTGDITHTVFCPRENLLRQLEEF